MQNFIEQNQKKQSQEYPTSHYSVTLATKYRISVTIESNSKKTTHFGKYNIRCFTLCEIDFHFFRSCLPIFFRHIKTSLASILYYENCNLFHQPCTVFFIFHCISRLDTISQLALRILHSSRLKFFKASL